MASLILGLAACGSDDELVGGTGESESASVAPDVIRGVRVNPDLLQPPGTQLAEGVEVQDSTWLVGGVFPRPELQHSTSGPVWEADGWQALVVSELDPIATWETYVEELGVADVAPPETACVVRRPLPDAEPTTESNSPYGPEAPSGPFERFLTADPLEGEQLVWCSVRISVAPDYEFGEFPPPGVPAQPFEAVLASGVQWCPDPGLDDDPCEPRPVSHLFMRMPAGGVTGEPRDVYLGTSGVAYLPTTPEEVAAGTTRPPPPGEFRVLEPGLPRAALPDVGDRFDGGIDYYLNDMFVVPVGGELAAGPAIAQDCNSGLVVVLEVTGDPQDAAASASGVASGDSVAQLDTPQGRVAVADVNSAGGYYLTATAIDGPRPQESLVLITECGD